MGSAVTVVLIVSTGAAWESRALSVLQAGAGTVVLKRCVDVADLLATASTGQAQVAVVGTDLPGLDRTVVEELGRYDVRVVGVATESARGRAEAARTGVLAVLDASRIDDLASLVTALPADPTLPPADALAASDATAPTSTGSSTGSSAGRPPGRVLVVWGPGGAPGRTTLACAIAGELARRGLATLLVDADPYGGAVAQQLGVLDEVSGLLSVARLVAAGTLPERFASAQRRLSDLLSVVTGLPRPDRWTEVRPGTIAALVERARVDGQVVVDTGFGIEQDPAADLGRPARDDLTREALEAADDVVLVGGADPVGLARLARALTELHELLPDPAVHVVVNRMRSTLGWREADVVAMLAGFGPSRGVHFLPDDQAAVDRAQVAGRLLVEVGESSLSRAVGALLDAMVGDPATASAVRR